MKYTVLILFIFFLKQAWAKSVGESNSDAEKESVSPVCTFEIFEMLLNVSVPEAPRLLSQVTKTCKNFFELFGASFDLLEVENTGQRVSLLSFFESFLVFNLMISIILLLLATYIVYNKKSRCHGILQFSFLITKSVHISITYYITYRCGGFSSIKDHAETFGILKLSILEFNLALLTLILLIFDSISKRRRHSRFPKFWVCFYYTLATACVILMPQYHNFTTNLPLYHAQLVILFIGYKLFQTKPHSKSIKVKRKRFLLNPRNLRITSLSSRY